MGVINLTPDSFHPASRVSSCREAIESGLRLEESGADIIDVGGMSSRPGAKEIPIEEECERVLPVVEGLRKRCGAFLSVDTYRPEVARRAIACGADMINDISGLRLGIGLENVVREGGAYIVLMHMRGRPSDMQQHANYGDLINDVSKELNGSIEKALKGGISREKIIIDPGIGFAKTAEQNLAVMKHLPVFKEKGYPLLVGLSRKSFLGAVTGLGVEERLIPTVAANALAIFLGADIIRVHDVKEAVMTARVVDSIMHSR